MIPYSMTELSTRISIITNALDMLNSFLYLNSVINYFFFALFRSIPMHVAYALLSPDIGGV